MPERINWVGGMRVSVYGFLIEKLTGAFGTRDLGQ